MKIKKKSKDFIIISKAVCDMRNDLTNIYPLLSKERVKSYKNRGTITYLLKTKTNFWDGV